MCGDGSGGTHFTLSPSHAARYQLKLGWPGWQKAGRGPHAGCLRMTLRASNEGPTATSASAAVHITERSTWGPSSEAHLINLRITRGGEG